MELDNFLKPLSKVERQLVKSKTLEVCGDDIQLEADTEKMVTLYVYKYRCYCRFYKVNARDCVCNLKSQFSQSRFFKGESIIRKSWRSVFSALEKKL